MRWGPLASIPCSAPGCWGPGTAQGRLHASVGAHSTQGTARRSPYTCRLTAVETYLNQTGHLRRHSSQQGRQRRCQRPTKPHYGPLRLCHCRFRRRTRSARSCVSGGCSRRPRPRPLLARCGPLGLRSRHAWKAPRVTAGRRRQRRSRLQAIHRLIACWLAGGVSPCGWRAGSKRSRARRGSQLGAGLQPTPSDVGKIRCEQQPVPRCHDSRRTLRTRTTSCATRHVRSRHPAKAPRFHGSHPDLPSSPHAPTNASAAPSATSATAAGSSPAGASAAARLPLGPPAESCAAAVAGRCSGPGCCDPLTGVASPSAAAAAATGAAARPSVAARNAAAALGSGGSQPPAATPAAASSAAADRPDPLPLG
jgi:hypothetical protein